MSFEKKDDSGFHVKLDGIELSNEAKERIQSGIQAVVLKELAGYPNPDDDEKPSRPRLDGGVIYIPPRWWWGFIARSVLPQEVDNIPGLNEAFNSQKF